MSKLPDDPKKREALLAFEHLCLRIHRDEAVVTTESRPDLYDYHTYWCEGWKMVVLIGGMTKDHWRHFNDVTSPDGTVLEFDELYAADFLWTESRPGSERTWQIEHFKE